MMLHIHTMRTVIQLDALKREFDMGIMGILLDFNFVAILFMRYLWMQARSPHKTLFNVVFDVLQNQRYFRRRKQDANPCF